MIVDSEAEKQEQNESQSNRLAKVLLVSEEMLGLARDNEWQLVAELEKTRRENLEQCFALPVPDGSEQLFSEALAAMLTLNEELIALLETAKSDIAIKRIEQGRNKKSISFYLDAEDTKDKM
jgi:hypothetical protein